jgi:putative membrane protein
LTPISEISEDALDQPGPDLGAMRTVMAADRTLTALIRTSLAMLSFGYTIYKILQEVQESVHVPLHGASPRVAGISLTVTGTAALIMGIAQYIGSLRLLRRVYLFQLVRPTLVMSVLMAITGTLVSLASSSKCFDTHITSQQSTRVTARRGSGCNRPVAA